MKRYFPLLILTAAFLGALAYFTARDLRAGEGSYWVTVQRPLPGDSAARRALDINTATAAQLEELVGIGPVLAQAIVDYREKHGGFASVDELLEVSGIGESKLEGIRKNVTIGGES